MLDSYTEVGIGFVTGNNYQRPFGSQWASVNLASYSFGSATPLILTGVAYNDNDMDNFYTPDGTEALGGITVQALDAMGSTVTFGSGGYSLTGLAAGTYTVRFVDTDGTYYDAGQAVLGTENVKIDAINAVFVPEPSSALLFSIGSLACFLRRRG